MNYRKGGGEEEEKEEEERSFLEKGCKGVCTMLGGSGGALSLKQFC